MSTKIDLAGVWLMELLQDQDMLAVDIYRLGSAHDPQFSTRTLKRAKERVGLIGFAKSSAREFTKNKLEELKAIKLRNVNVDSELDEEIKGLQSSLKQQSGRIRWFWGFPSSPDLYKLSVAEVERQYELSLAQTQRLADMLHRMNRDRRKLEQAQPPISESAPKPAAVDQPLNASPAVPEEGIDFDSQSEQSPTTEPEPPAVPPEPVVANRIRF